MFCLLLINSVTLGCKFTNIFYFKQKNSTFAAAMKENTIIRYDREDLLRAVDVMQHGGIILYPTDTVWGIGCDATNEDAVKKIFQLKQRADSKSMLVLLDGAGKLQGYVDDIPQTAWELLEYATEPLTIIYPKAKNVAPQLIAEDGSLGIRITNEIFSKTLCERLHKPIVSTSANISGEKAPQCFSQISEEIKNGVDYIVNYRRNDETKAQPSHIIKVSENQVIKIIR